jgi:hypothetical protein
LLFDRTSSRRRFYVNNADLNIRTKKTAARSKVSCGFQLAGGGRSPATVRRERPSGRAVAVQAEQHKCRYTAQDKKIEPGEVLDNRGHRTILLTTERNTPVFCSGSPRHASLLLAALQWRRRMHCNISNMLKEKAGRKAARPVVLL